MSGGGHTDAIMAIRGALTGGLPWLRPVEWEVPGQREITALCSGQEKPQQTPHRRRRTLENGEILATRMPV